MAFDGNGALTILGVPGSAAERCALDHGFVFRAAS